jgi:hypothetical protein
MCASYRNDVGVLEVEVVVLAIYVSGYDGGEVTVVLLLVCSVLDVNHALGVRIPKLGEI